MSRTRSKAQIEAEQRRETKRRGKRRRLCLDFTDGLTEAIEAARRNGESDQDVIRRVMTN